MNQNIYLIIRTPHVSSFEWQSCTLFTRPKDWASQLRHSSTHNEASDRTLMVQERGELFYAEGGTLR